MLSVDLNCDMGESTNLYAYDIEKDFSMLAYLSSINLACGFHAGDATTMHRLVTAALKRNVGIGAHPSYPDRDSFGRTDMRMGPENIYDIILYQLGALQAFLQVHGARLNHVKPHGALYNKAAVHRETADAIAAAVRDYDKTLTLFALSGSELVTCARQMGLSTVSEVFADRTYLEDGSLTPRTAENALIEDKSLALKQVLQMTREGTVTTTGGKTIQIEAGSICVHGDGKDAVGLARMINEVLRENNIAILKPGLQKEA